MPAHKFRGRDRRILEKFALLCRLIEDRDTIALGIAATSQISTRALMVDPSVPGLLTSMIQVRDHFAGLLTQ